MNKLALITGASSGIGFELAKVMAQNGHDLILVSRSQKNLEEIAIQLRKQHTVKVHVVPFDLSQPHSGEGLFNALRKFNDEIEILVNNAGFGDSGALIEQNLSRIHEMMTLNMGSLTELSRLYGAKFAELKRGAILNVASTAAFQPGPFMAVYFATKAYVLSFTEALREELKSHNVQVSALCPGPTSTNFIDRARVSKLRFFNGATVMTADEVARLAYIGMQKDQGIIVTGWLNYASTLASKLSPRAVTRWVVKGMTTSSIN
jgi:uncharacterized protein